MGSQFDLFLVYFDGPPWRKIFWFQKHHSWEAFFGRRNFLSPVAGSSFSDPVWGPNLISFWFIMTDPPGESFFGFQFCPGFWPFFATFFFIVTDGWWMVDGGGWWWMVVDGGGWSKKKSSDFAQNFFGWSSGDINVPLFRILWRHVFKWKKIRFEVRNFRNFSTHS